jgi:hypothetical protein
MPKDFTTEIKAVVKFNYSDNTRYKENQALVTNFQGRMITQLVWNTAHNNTIRQIWFTIVNAFIRLFLDKDGRNNYLTFKTFVAQKLMAEVADENDPAKLFEKNKKQLQKAISLEEIPEVKTEKENELAKFLEEKNLHLAKEQEKFKLSKQEYINQMQVSANAHGLNQLATILENIDPEKTDYENLLTLLSFCTNEELVKLVEKDHQLGTNQMLISHYETFNLETEFVIALNNVLKFFGHHDFLKYLADDEDFDLKKSITEIKENVAKEQEQVKDLLLKQKRLQLETVSKYFDSRMAQVMQTVTEGKMPLYRAYQQLHEASFIMCETLGEDPYAEALQKAIQIQERSKEKLAEQDALKPVQTDGAVDVPVLKNNQSDDLAEVLNLDLFGEEEVLEGGANPQNDKAETPVKIVPATNMIEKKITLRERVEFLLKVKIPDDKDRLQSFVNELKSVNPKLVEAALDVTDENDRIFHYIKELPQRINQAEEKLEKLS